MGGAASHELLALLTAVRDEHSLPMSHLAPYLGCSKQAVHQWIERGGVAESTAIRRLEYLAGADVPVEFAWAAERADSFLNMYVPAEA